MQQEVRTLTVDPNIITHLIRSQAGSFGKAVVESIMNSLDAGATDVRIDVDAAGYSITDNGHGFRTREEILRCFEVFGFVHDDRSRDMGRFGLGRAQAFNWASNIWRTRSFKLEVDIRARGLDYVLTERLEDVPGLRIEGRFYEPMSEVDRHALLQEVETLCRYVQVSVLFNGRRINNDPARQRWSYEDEECYLKVAERSTLAVYSQGVFVREYPTSRVGVGGTLVTKLGFPLELNMSRSDVLTHQCTRWARLRQKMKELGSEAARGAAKKSRMTDTQRDFLAAEAANPANAAYLTEKLVELSNGRCMSPVALGNALRDSHVILTVAERGNRLADVALQEHSAVVVSHRTLGRFGVDSVAELAKLLADYLARGDADLRNAAHGLRYALTDGRVFDTFEQCPVYRRLDAQTLPEQDWTAAEKCVIRAVTDSRRHIQYLVRRKLAALDVIASDAIYDAPDRALCVGQSLSCEAFTDGATYIAISRDVLKSVYGGGLGDMQRLVAMLVHEYLHDNDSATSHEHDHAFFEAFHDTLLSNGGELYTIGAKAFRAMCTKRDRVTKRQAKELDRIANG